jgi:hypothetical protein
MLALWVLASPADVKSYAATLILPSYLAHLQLAELDFANQAAHRDGCEPLVLRYRGEGRVEDYELDPQKHALGMIRFFCPTIDPGRVQLPKDDARWFWPSATNAEQVMRIYFSPVAGTLGRTSPRPQFSEAYVSVSRGHVFLGLPAVQAYLAAWLEHIGLSTDQLSMESGVASGAIEFRAGRIGGQLFVDQLAVAEDLIGFAGLRSTLSEVRTVAALDLQSPGGRCGAFADGVYFPLSTVRPVLQMHELQEKS